MWQATPAILNSDIVNEQGEENKNNGLNEVGISDEKTYEVPVTAVSLSSELDYKNAKKVARQEFKNKKKELKSSYPKQKKNNFKNSTIVLSVLLAVATVINVVQFVYYNDKISNLKVR